VLPGNWLAGRKALFIALGLGSFAGVVSYAAIRTQQQKLRNDWRTVRILCAARDVPEGAEVDRDMLAARDFPVRFVTESFLRVRDDGTVKDDPVGQRLRAPLKAGDPILASHFEGVRDTDLSAMVNPRGRAVTIDVQERNAVGLWVKPNDHVDVIGSFRDGQTQSLRTVTLLQNVIVLATGKVNASTPPGGDQDHRYTTVTLLVLPEEAEILTLAQETGTLTLLLRNPEDLDVQEKRAGVDQKQILTGERAGELQQKRYKTFEIIRGRGGNQGVAQRSE
jgi:pilus assembly protein CpaB